MEIYELPKIDNVDSSKNLSFLDFPSNIRANQEISEQILKSTTFTATLLNILFNSSLQLNIKY